MQRARRDSLGYQRSAIEKKQRLLFRAVDIGVELLVMMVTAARGQSLHQQGTTTGALDLADVFCRGARRRIDGWFSAMRHNDDVVEYQSACDVLAGRFWFLEMDHLSQPAPSLGDSKPARPSHAAE